MSRYLTPSKLSLLALTSLYCDAVVPNSAVIPVLSFILSHLLPLTSSVSDTTPYAIAADFEPDVQSFAALISTRPSSVPGRSLYDLFLKKLWSIDSFHALHVFFRSLDEYLAQAPQPPQDRLETSSNERILISRISPLGIFIRRARLEFTRIHFHDAVKLWASFLVFRAPSEQAWKRRNPSAASLALDISLCDIPRLERSEKLFQACYGSLLDLDSQHVFVSTDDIERTLEFHLDRLQRLGNRMPVDMKQRFRTLMMQAAGTPSLVYFVSFFDAWRAGNYTGAFENLHRYFDYTTQARDKSYYHEAIASMNETIATARENQDISCLNFGLSWLNHLCKAYPKEMSRAGYVGMAGSERKGLEFLKSKAQDSRTWNLLSSSLLSETKLSLSAGDGIAQALEHLYQSSHLNLMHHIHSNVGTQLLMQSSVYGRLGLHQLADIYCEILLDAYSNTSPIEETIRASCRRAYTYFMGFSITDTKHAIQMGLYSSATSILRSVDDSVNRTLKLHQYTASYSGLFKTKVALRRQHIPTAELLLTQLRSGASSEPDMDFQIFLLEIDLSQRKGSFSTAQDRVEAKITELKNEDSDVYQRIHLMVLRSLCYAKIGPPARALTAIIRAAAVAHRSRLQPALWEAMGVLSYMLSMMQEFRTACNLLEAIIPQALGGCDLALCAQLYAWQANACMGLASSTDGSTTDRTALLSKAETYLERSGNYFGKVEDVREECGIFAKRSLIAKMRGDLSLAADWASKYSTLYGKHLNEDLVDGLV